MRTFAKSSFWISSVLLLAQLLSVGSILVLVSTEEMQNAQARHDLEMVNKLTQLQIAIRELDNCVTLDPERTTACNPPASWGKRVAELQAEVGRFADDRRNTTIREGLNRAEAALNEIISLASILAGPDRNSTAYQQAQADWSAESDIAIQELVDAVRTTRVRASLTLDNVAEKTTNIKLLIMVSCLLALCFAGIFRENRRSNARRKEIERTLRDNEERYRHLVECANDVVFRVNPHGQFVFTNNAFERVSGYSPEEALLLTGCQLLAHDEVERGREFLREALKGDSQEVREFTIATKAGERRSVEVSTRLFTQENGQRFIQGIARDVTEKNQLEERLHQSSKMESLGQLAGGIAHDFNNILMVIGGYTDSVLAQLPDHPCRTDIAEIKAASERAAVLTRQLLAFSRKQVLQPQIVDLNEVVEGCEKLLGRVLGENIELRTSLQPSLALVKLDRSQLEHVILNLAINARDAMPNGGRLSIKTSNVYSKRSSGRLEGQPLSVMLEVTDNGRGMTPEVRARLFDPFFTTKEPGKGTGLGLSIVYGMVKQSGGDIEVSSELGSGSSFRIYFPPAPHEEDHTTARDIGSSLKGSETILVVEDEDPLRTLISRALKARGYHTLEARGGPEAMLLLHSHKGPIHLVITDMIMPDMSGEELWGRVCSSRPDMKVLYMSGYLDKWVDAGAEHPFLQKPFAIDLLALTVRQILDETPHGPQKAIA